MKKAADGASVVHDGVIESQGGIVSLSAQEAQAVRTNVVSVGGVVKATRIERRGGVVYLSGGTQGIAEVSGEVQASRKVQTTGEYVVVKDGALLKAPEILVGGDFQGKGDVPTARRTLVEAGALLNAGKNGRVIVWSDETTWFNGDISAPEGFAEVSGKEVLASVNLAGIDVGELLLDPADIFIEETGLNTLNGNIAAGDPPSSLTLDVDDINGFAPDLSIASSNSLRLNAVINKAAGNLTLITPGILTLGGNITTAGDLTLDGGVINLPTNGNAITLTGRAVTLLTGAVAGNQAANDNDFTITASGNITINNNINLDTGTLTLTAGNGGTGNIVSGAGTQTLTASTVSLTQDSVFGSSAPFRFAAGTLNLTTGAAQTVQGWMTDGNRALSLTSGGMLTINSNIDTGTGNLTLTLGASQAALTGVSMLSGNVVTFNGDGTGVRITADGDLTISALGNLRVNTGIAVGANTLRLLAGRNEAAGQTGVISFANTSVALSASRFVFTQDGARFADGRPADFRDGDGTGLTTAQSEPITRIIYDGAGAAQTGVDWANIFPSTVSRGPGGTGDYAVPAVDFVSGVLAAAVSITLDAGTGVLTFAATGDITLRAPTITITAGTINLGADRTLTLTAETGTLTLNFTAATTITGMGTAALTVIAEDIAFSGTPPILNVPTVSLELTLAATINPSGVVLVPGSSFGQEAPFSPDSTIGTLILAVSTPQTYYSWMAAMGRNLNLSAGGFRDITINAAEINLGTGDLTLSAFNTVITHASGLTIRARNFLHGGTFCGVNPGSDPCIASSNGVRVFADGNITLNTDFGLSAGGSLRIELRADADGDGMGMITSTPRSLGASSLILQQAGAFAADLFTTTSVVDGAVDFRITTAVAQTIHPWMAGLGGTTFSLRGVDGVTLASITLPAAADFGTAAVDLQATAIALTAATTLTGGAISLTGAITASNNLTITAMGVLTLNSDINIGTNALTLTSGVGAIGATGRPRLTAGMVSFSQVDALPVTRPFRFIPGSSLAITTEAPQDVHDWMIRENIDLTVTSSNRVRVVAIIGSGDGAGRNLGTGSITLTSTGGTVRILANISITNNITLSGVTGGINFNSGTGAKTLSGAIVTISGDARSNRDLTITASGVLTLNSGINTGTSALSLSGSSVALGGALTLTGGAITLTGAAMGADSLTITASGTLTLNNDINIGTNALTLTSGVGAIVGAGRPRLTAGMVSLAQVDAFPVTRTLRVIPGSSLAITTEAAQDVHDWMIIENIDLTVTSSNRVRVVAIIGTGGVAGRNLGTGALSLTSTGGAVRILDNITTGGNITLSGGAGGINLNGTATLTGAAITLTGDARGNRDLTLDASGTLRINSNITLTGTGALSLSSDTVVRILANITTGGNITLSGGTNGINLNSGAAAKTLSGAAITLTGDARSNRDLTINASGTLTLNGGINTGTSALSLSGSSVALGGALTLTGGDITLTGAATGTADLTLTASGILTLNNDIAIGANALTLTSGVGAIVATGRPRLTAGMVSFSQVDALPVTRPFRFIPGSSLAITTEAMQDVHDWMIRENIDLTVTSSNRVRVVAIIGTGGVAGRNLGTGALSLTSTGGAVRILANISISNNITLSGVTDGINLNGTDTLSGAIITLTGDARGNRDLTLTATGVLTINNNINIGTTGTTLTLTGASLTFGSSVALTAGAYSLSDGRACNTGTSPSCTTITP